jgi:tetratricopeptide (TPR) repeat protein
LEANPKDKELAKKTRKALQGLRKCGNLFRVAMPRYWCYAGWYAWLTGSMSRASVSWEKGLRLANQLEMKYEAAILYFQSGKYQASKSDLQKAAEEFESLGAKYNLEQVMNVLSKI